MFETGQAPGLFSGQFSKNTAFPVGFLKKKEKGVPFRQLFSVYRQKTVFHRFFILSGQAATYLCTKF